MKDYINDTFIRLTDEGRIKDAVEFCEMVAKDAPCVEFRCVALKNLAECHFFMTGDGEACRDANMRGLKLMEDNPDIFSGTSHMSEVQIKRLYSDFCEQFRAVAVSFEEYEEYCEKPLRVRERNATERRGLKAVKQLKSQNAGWIENMFILLNNYCPQSQWQSRIPAAAQGACIAQLILLNSRSLRAKPLDVNFAIQQYQNCMVANIENLVDNTKRKSFSPCADQIFFTFDRATEIIESMRNDRRADEPTIDKCIDTFIRMRAAVTEKLDSYVSNGGNYITLDMIKSSFDSEMEKLKTVDFGSFDTGILNNKVNHNTSFQTYSGNQNNQGDIVNPGTGSKIGCLIRIVLFLAMTAGLIWLILNKCGGQ